jgi:hypothetical protein
LEFWQKCRFFREKGKEGKVGLKMLIMDSKKIMNYKELMTLFTEVGKRLDNIEKRLDKIAESNIINEYPRQNAASDTEKDYDEQESLRREIKRIRDEEFAEKWHETQKMLGIVPDDEITDDIFYYTLKAKKHFAGVYFGDIGRNFKSVAPLGGKQYIEGEYDIVMMNDTALSVFEVKDKVMKDDVERMADKKYVENFKLLFPMYAKFDFYLGIAGMSFDKQAEDAARKLGIGVLKIKGDVVEIDDMSVKLY